MKKRNLKGLLKIGAFVNPGTTGTAQQPVLSGQEQYPDWQPVIDAVGRYVDSTGATPADTFFSGGVLDRLTHVISGGPYSQKNFAPQNSRSLLIGVGGYGEGNGGMGARYFDWMRDKPNTLFLRHDESDRLRDILNAARQSKIPAVVMGHSYGGASVANLAHEYPEVFFVATDPVSRFKEFKDVTRDNLMYQMPRSIDPLRHPEYGNIISALGGRWHPPYDSTMYYNSPYHADDAADKSLEGVSRMAQDWMVSGMSAEDVKKKMQANLRRQRGYRTPTEYPETSREYQDAHTYKGNTPPEGWIVPDVSGTPQMPNVFGEM